MPEHPKGLEQGRGRGRPTPGSQDHRQGITGGHIDAAAHTQDEGEEGRAGIAREEAHGKKRKGHGQASQVDGRGAADPVCQDAGRKAGQGIAQKNQGNQQTGLGLIDGKGLDKRENQGWIDIFGHGLEEEDHRIEYEDGAK